MEQHRRQYEQLNITLEQTCNKSESRHYPFGRYTLYLLGDNRTQFKFYSGNNNFVEREYNSRLQGFDAQEKAVERIDPETGEKKRVLQKNYEELLPLLLHKEEPDNVEVKRVTERERDIHLTIDIRLQLRLHRILQAKLQETKQKERASAVVLDPSTGDLLASASFPLIENFPARSSTEETDRETFDRAYFGTFTPVLPLSL